MITADDLLNSDKGQRNQSLYGSMGFNPTENNAIGAGLRRLGQGAYWNAAQGMGFQNSLEPQRQAAIQSLVNINNPATMVSNAQAQGQRIMSQGSESGAKNAAQMGMMGYGAGAQAGAMNQGQNQGVELANHLMMQAYSGDAQSQALLHQLNAISQSSGMGLQELLAMFMPVEQRNQANAAAHANNGLGAIGGILGNVLGSMGPIGGAAHAISGGQQLLGGGGGGMFGMLGQGINSIYNQNIGMPGSSQGQGGWYY